MAFEGELPDVDMLKMSPGELDLPAPMMSLDLPAPDQDTKATPVAPAPQAAAKKPAPAGKPAAGKPQGKPAPQKAAVAKKPAAQVKLTGDTVHLLLSLVSIILLVIISVVMVLFEVPVNAMPELNLTTYVQALWLLVGCFFIVAMLQDIKTALMLTGIDIVLLVTVFPTLWLLLNMPMNPMYFFVIGLIMLLACVYMPLNMLRPKALPARA
ncbi:hypothetical protein [Methanocella sp. MCL-LM]|uniref:hypothetical protein n=1 Tax=Methanocella sp. MCL-LM TaxID=3412035 RepID=UPI003C743E7C